MSRRTTPTTVNTKIHSSRSSPNLATTRTSSLKVSAVHPEGQRGGAHLDQVARVERDGGDPLTVDHRAVGGAEVGQHGLGTVEVDASVPARDAHVRQAQ